MTDTALLGSALALVTAVRWALSPLAIIVVADALARPSWHFGGTRAARWRWVAPQALFLFVVAAGFVTPAPDALDVAAVLAVPVVMVVDVMYLARVAFPAGERALSRSRARRRMAGVPVAGMEE